VVGVMAAYFNSPSNMLLGLLICLCTDRPYFI